MNKKEKKKFKRKNIRLKNRNLYNIQNYEDAEIIEDKLAELILEGKVKEGDEVEFDADTSNVIVRVNGSEVARDPR